MSAGTRIVCLGEALVDFVCERPVESLGAADSFVPRQGGSLANIAVAAARYSDRVEMIGGAGDDEWGRWLKDRIAAEGVGVDRFELMPGAGTSHAFVSVSADGEPAFAFYGDPERPAAHAGSHLNAALDGEPGVLVVGSDTLLGAAEREVTMRAVELAGERAWRVLCDPNLRPNRWESEEAMVAVISDLVAGSDVVKLNEGEARALTSANDLASAGERLLALGPEGAVITRGENGALIVSAEGAESVEGVAARVVDATGAGDSVCGTLAAALANCLELRRAVPVAMRVAAGVVSVWGATTGLPSHAEARASLEAA